MTSEHISPLPSAPPLCSVPTLSRRADVVLPRTVSNDEETSSASVTRVSASQLAEALAASEKLLVVTVGLPARGKYSIPADTAPL